MGNSGCRKFDSKEVKNLKKVSFTWKRDSTRFLKQSWSDSLCGFFFNSSLLKSNKHARRFVQDHMTQKTVLIKANWLFWRKECSWIISITGKMRCVLEAGIFFCWLFLHCYLCSKWLSSSFYVIVFIYGAPCEHCWKLCALCEC